MSSLLSPSRPGADVTKALHHVPYAAEPVLAVMMLLGDPAVAHARLADPTELAACAVTAIRLGRARAEQLGGFDPEGLLRDRGVALRRIAGEGPGARAGFHLAALTTVDTRHPGRIHVDVYPDAIARKGQALASMGVRVDMDSLARLHLAHECFHVIDLSEGLGSSDRAGAVSVRGALFGWRRRALGRSSEVAAHAFARAWMGDAAVPAPALVDELALMGMGESDLPGFGRRAVRACGLLRRAAQCHSGNTTTETTYEGIRDGRYADKRDEDAPIRFG